MLQDSTAARCEPTLYWPAAVTHFPVAAFAVEAPEPLYELLGFSGKLYNGLGAFNTDRDCSLEAGVRVFAFLQEGDPSTLQVSDLGVLDVTVVAEATLTGAGAGPFVSVEVTLPTPVRVKQTGTLWLGYDASLDATTGPGGCLGGCTKTNASFWGWSAEANHFDMPPGWAERSDGNVLLAATVRKD